MSKDTIYRQAALDIAMQYCPDDDGSCSKADADIREMLDELENLPSAHPEKQIVASIHIDRDELEKIVAEQVEEIIKALPEWIPCAERMPEDNVEVFVYLFQPPQPYIAWVRDGEWHTEEFKVDDGYEPIAWFPKPAPFREDETC